MQTNRSESCAGPRELTPIAREIRAFSQPYNNINHQTVIDLSLAETHPNIQSLLDDVRLHDEYSNLSNYISGLLSLPLEEWKAFDTLHSSQRARSLLTPHLPQLYLIIPNDLWKLLQHLQYDTDWPQVQDTAVSILRFGSFPWTAPENSTKRGSDASDVTSPRLSSDSSIYSKRHSSGSSMTSTLSRSCSFKQMQAIDETEQESEHTVSTNTSDIAMEVSAAQIQPLTLNKSGLNKPIFPCTVKDCRQKPYRRIKDLVNHLNNHHRAIFQGMTYEQLEKFARDTSNLDQSSLDQLHYSPDSSHDVHDHMIDRPKANTEPQTPFPKTTPRSVNRSASETFWAQPIRPLLVSNNSEPYPNGLGLHQTQPIDTTMGGVALHDTPDLPWTDWSKFLANTSPPEVMHYPQPQARLGNRSLRDSMHMLSSRSSH